jgi:alkylation response protein AidB-like acyl-CoA dehydrogenase
MPDTVIWLMPASELEFLDTWHVVGLKGTNSCDVVAHDVFVPERFTFNIFTATSFFDTPASRLPFRPAAATGHSAFAIGVARGALDDIAALAVTKRAAMNPGSRLAEDVVFQHQLGEQDLRLQAAKAFLDSQTANAWDACVEGRALTPVELLRLRLMAGYITAECVKVVDAAYTMAGSTSLYETSTLQRRLRDIHVATQHVAATSEAYRTLGKLLAGEEVQPMELF